MAPKRENWGSSIGFIMAAAGSAIGLGNIWKFPYIAGENGGAAFIIVYLLCIAVVGLPVLMAEILLGRTTQRNPVGAFKALSGSRFWTAIGGLGVIAGFVILSFYSVIAGWSLGYFLDAIRGTLLSSAGTVEASSNHFNSLVGNVTWIVSFHTVFALLTMGVVYFGIKKGIERGSKVMMPLLLVILIVLIIRGVTLDGAEAGWAFLLKPDWSKISGQSILIALGHAFFTLSLGMGAMMTYGSYLSKKDNILTSSIKIVFLDTLIAMMAGVAIFTAVFATGMNPGQGPGLIFHTLPVVFSRMPGGDIFAALFFLLLTVAALTSSISLLEVVTAYFIDEKKWKRPNAVLVFGFVIFLVGIPSALSFNVMADVKLFGKTYFDIADFLASNIMLPAGGFFIAIFVGWVWGFDKAIVSLKQGSENLFDNNPWLTSGWKIFLKYIAPVMIFIVLLHSLSLLDPIINWLFN